MLNRELLSPEFSKRLEAYFDKEMILDIKKYLPSDDKYLIWGMDVGDFQAMGIMMWLCP